MTDRDDGGFARRWSRRKRTARVQPADPPAAVAPAAADASGKAADEAEIVAQLPDIDSMDESSDFSVFLREGVPETLRRKALRKLWRLNPMFANLDGLNDYDEDFTNVGVVAEVVKTVYKVGRGMLDDDEEEGAEARAAAATAEPAPPDPSDPADPAADTAAERLPPDPARPDTAAAAPARRAKKGSAKARRWGGFTS